MQLKKKNLLFFVSILVSLNTFSYAKQNINTTNINNLSSNLNEKIKIKNIQIATLFGNKQLKIFLHNNYQFFKNLGIPIYIYKTDKNIYEIFTYTDSQFFINILKKKFKDIIVTNYKPFALKTYDIEPVLLENQILKKFPLTIIKENLNKLENVKEEYKNKFYNCYKNISILKKIVVIPSKCTKYIFPFLNDKNNVEKFTLKNNNINYFFIRKTPYPISKVFIFNIQPKKTDKKLVTSNFVISNMNKNDNIITNTSSNSINIKDDKSEQNNTNKLSDEVKKIIQMTNKISKNLIYKTDLNDTLPKNLIGIKILNLVEKSPFFDTDLLAKIKKVENNKKINLNGKIKNKKYNNDVSLTKINSFKNSDWNKSIQQTDKIDIKNNLIKYINLIIITGIFVLLFTIILLIKYLKNINKKLNKLKKENSVSNNSLNSLKTNKTSEFLNENKQKEEVKFSKNNDKSYLEQLKEIQAEQKQKIKEVNKIKEENSEIENLNKEINIESSAKNKISLKKVCDDLTNETVGQEKINKKEKLENQLLDSQFFTDTNNTNNKERLKNETELKEIKKENFKLNIKKVDKEKLKIKEEIKKDLFFKKPKRIKKTRKDSK